MIVYTCTRGEMDITTVFGTVIVGSNPAGCTMRVWFSGRMTAFQAVDGSSILPTRTIIINLHSYDL